jgi:EmrB/QacA subfamily drug resistance transporter
VFTASSLTGGLAASGLWLITARAVQGLGAAMLAPATLSLLTSRFTVPHERRKALSAWSTTSASGAAVGVLAGGILTGLLSWRWVLFVNIPIGIAVIVLTLLAVSEPRVDGPRARLDILGAVTVTLGFTFLLYGIVGTDTHPWTSPQTVITLALGGVLLAAFVLAETRVVKAPLIPFSVFKRRSLTVANGVTTTIGAANFGGYFFLSLYLQQVNGYPPLRAGLAFLPIGLSAFTGSLISHRLVDRIGARNQLILGTGIAAAGLIWIAVTLTPVVAYLSTLLGPLILFGCGIGMSFGAMAMAATHGVPAHQAGLASGLLNTTRQVGGAAGLAVMATAASSLTHGLSGAHSSAAALTAGYKLAFLIAGLGLAAGMLLAFALPTAARERRDELRVPATAPAGTPSSTDQRA